MCSFGGINNSGVISVLVGNAVLAILWFNREAATKSNSDLVFLLYLINLFFSCISSSGCSWLCVSELRFKYFLNTFWYVFSKAQHVISGIKGFPF
jgi:hypothetical protein